MHGTPWTWSRMRAMMLCTLIAKDVHNDLRFKELASAFALNVLIRDSLRVAADPRPSLLHLPWRPRSPPSTLPPRIPPRAPAFTDGRQIHGSTEGEKRHREWSSRWVKVMQSPPMGATAIARLTIQRLVILPVLLRPAVLRATRPKPEVRVYGMEVIS